MAFNPPPIKSGQRGAAMVEFAITVLIYLLFIFAIIEFSLVIFRAAQLAESTRAGARYAVVNNPACDIFGNGGDACPGGPLDCSADPANQHLSTTVTVGDCPDPISNLDYKCKIVEEMDLIMFGRTPILSGSGNVQITYSCPTTPVGDPNLPPVLVVTVSAEDIEHDMLLLGGSITLPAFSTSRTGEDLFNR